MAVEDRSVGAMYIAWVGGNRVWCWPRIVGVIQTEPPWRKGRALLIPVFPFRAVVIGVWRKRPIDPTAAEDGEWFNLKEMDVTVEEISHWVSYGNHTEPAG